MPGRHHSPGAHPGWAPTAVNAVTAVAPGASLIAALGIAGGGYLVGREDVAACGAVVGAFGLLAERLQTRSVRRRLRRERLRHRDDLRGVTRELSDLQRQLAAIREELVEVRAERDGIRDRLPMPSAAPVAVPVSVPDPVPVADPVPAPAPASIPGSVGRSAAGFLPGQVRSPIATGGIPVLAPGPSEPVKVIDLTNTGPISAPATGPAPTLRAQVVDALVWAALAEADSDELTRVLEGPGQRLTHGTVRPTPGLIIVDRGHVA